MFTRLDLPYTCNARCTRLLQEKMHAAYKRDNTPDALSRVGHDLLSKFIDIDTRIADNISLFISNGRARSSGLVKQKVFLGMKRGIDAKQYLDSIQEVRRFLISKEYEPWSPDYTLRWGDFCSWYNKLPEINQIQAEDYFELVSGVGIRELISTFAQDMIYHLQSGHSLYPLPSYNDYTKQYERPDLVANSFGVIIGKVEAKKGDSGNNTPLFPGNPSSSLNWDDYVFCGFDDDSYSDEDESLPYPILELGSCTMTDQSWRTLSQCIDYVIQNHSNPLVDRKFYITILNVQICTLAVKDGIARLNSIDIEEEIPSMISKSEIIQEFRKCCSKLGVKPTLQHLLTDDLGV